MEADLETWITTCLADDVDTAWVRCLPVWRAAGQINSLRHGKRYPRHAVTDGAVLGGAFARCYQEAHGFLGDKLRSADALEAICAFDLLEAIAWNYWGVDEPLPASLTELDVPLPACAAAEIAGEPCFEGFTGTTIGEYLPYMLEHS